MKLLKIVAVLAAFAAAPVAAHEKGDRQRGIVESIAPERIVVKTSDGHATMFKVTPETRFFRGEESARAQDVRVGERVVVQGKRAGETLEAAHVKLGAAPAPK